MTKSISIIGVGPGAADLLTARALERIEQAELLIGADRLLELFGRQPCRKIAAISPEEIVRHIHSGGCSRVCVLMSGDIGFYSGAKKLYPLLSGEAVETIPGLSSLQYLAARLRIPWEDIHPASAHGRSLNIAAHAAAHEKSFFLTGGDTTPQGLCAVLARCGMGDARVTVGSRLSYEQEEIVTATAAELALQQFNSLSAVLVQRISPPLWGYATGGIDDSLFVRGDVPMTKSEVRCLSIAKLRLNRDDTVYDIGAGTGSVAVEMALAASRGHVWAIERNPEALQLIARNREAFGAWNMEIAEGEAPDALQGLPAPDAAFVGGSGGRLESILRALLARNPQVRLAVNAITVETLADSVRLMEELGFAEVEVTQLAVARTRKAGASHMLSALNPVFIISGQGGGA
ncbi:MAG: Cobalt-precorrin-6y C5-methyltransferase [Paenibacillaceae bacterium]|jgi:precorrin-6Y C5,15-methyltransferase (decarboxylating)|nr:Cobalt-precorrin-6y C5-methyltransferase [Paenibacillaceae bacterium]